MLLSGIINRDSSCRNRSQYSAPSAQEYKPVITAKREKSFFAPYRSKLAQYLDAYDQ